MHPSVHARTKPDAIAFRMAGSGEAVTYRELDDRSNQGAQLFRRLGIVIGDTVALLMDNHPRFLEITWAAQRAGLYFTCISSKLSAGEVDYIMRDCGAKLLVVSPGIGAALLDELPALLPDVHLHIVAADRAGYERWEAAIALMPAKPVADETAGSDMLYSSGTTGRPKGVKVPLSGEPIERAIPLVDRLIELYGFPAETIYLNPAPLYHAAPLRYTMAVQRLGGTSIIMERFDPEQALALIEKHRINTAQFVPTHFVRMLKLPDAVREAYDLSSLEVVIHAAAPCPIPVKEQMIRWWGPIIHEYYSATEGTGTTSISPHEWLTHKGSVGRAILAEVRIVGEDGEELPPRTEGHVYFAGGPPLNYHNAPEKNAENTNALGWTTLGDIGWLDEDGYLYLTDRKTFMIISGGVNIYPQEIENLLITHPRVADAAVIGAPDEDMGEKVVAVVQPADWAGADDSLKDELLAFARAHLSHVKTPRQIDFIAELPRHATGKLYKRLLRDTYWGRKDSRIV